MSPRIRARRSFVDIGGGASSLAPGASAIAPEKSEFHSGFFAAARPDDTAPRARLPPPPSPRKPEAK
jgi:hypothetical protein